MLVSVSFKSVSIARVAEVPSVNLDQASYKISDITTGSLKSNCFFYSDCCRYVPNLIFAFPGLLKQMSLRDREHVGSKKSLFNSALPLFDPLLALKPIRSEVSDFFSMAGCWQRHRRRRRRRLLSKQIDFCSVRLLANVNFCRAGNLSIVAKRSSTI